MTHKRNPHDFGRRAYDRRPTRDQRNARLAAAVLFATAMILAIGGWIAPQAGLSAIFFVASFVALFVTIAALDAA